jgi:hypothetical protein
MKREVPRRKAEGGRVWLFMAQCPDEQLTRERPGIDLVLETIALREKEGAAAP